MRWLALLGCILWGWAGSAAAGEGDWQRALALAQQGPGPRDAGQAAALRSVLDQARAAGGADERWACLDLWLKAEWEDDPALPAARQRFLDDHPCSPCQEAADWWSARWVLRRVGPREAAPRLLRLAAAGPGSAFSARAGELALSVLEEALADSERQQVLAEVGERERAWWSARRASRSVAGKLLLVAPLGGADEAIGKAMRLGVENALEQARARDERWELQVLDCQSDPLLLREQVLRAAEVDAILVPGQPAYVAALGGLTDTPPLLALGYEGSDPASLSPRLLHFGVDPAGLGRAMATLALDSLAAQRAGTLGPATRASMRVVDGFDERWKASPDRARTPRQWYFYGARQLENQAGALSAEAGPGGAWIVLGSPREGAVLADLLARAPAGQLVLGDAGLLEALDGRVPANLAGRLFIVTDWLPASASQWVGETGLTGWTRFREAVQHQLGRGPGALESRSFETARLVLLAGSRARSAGRGLESELRRLREPSLFGGTARLDGQQAWRPALLGWTGHGFRPLDAGCLEARP